MSLARLAGWLQKIYDGHEPGLRLAKRILILPVVNVIGMHTRSRVWPFDKTDLNRMFPGYHAGETTQRIADAVFKLTRQAAIRIDIHSSNPEFEELPQVRLYGPSKQERATALKMGLPAVVECPSNRTSQSTLLHAWKQTGGQNFVVQGGSAGDLQLPHCHQLHRALCRLLRRLKILKGEQPLQGHRPHREHPAGALLQRGAYGVARFGKGGIVCDACRARPLDQDRRFAGRHLRRIQRPASLARAFPPSTGFSPAAAGRPCFTKAIYSPASNPCVLSATRPTRISSGKASKDQERFFAKRLVENMGAL